MPTFCRHNRFVERCPICKRDLPGAAPAGGGRRSARGAGTSGGPGGGRGGTRASRRPADERGPTGARRVRVQRETRAAEDGYHNELVPGLKASADAERLAGEIGFASARLSLMASAPPGVFAEIRARGGEGADGLERATWICFLTVYLSPLAGEDPFAGVRLVLERERQLVSGGAPADRDWSSPLDGVALGPRSSHDPARGSDTLRAYREWALRAGSQAKAIVGDEAWTAQRRFERAFERLALPGFGRAGRYEFLVTLGTLGLYELQADSLHLASGRGVAAEDLTTVAAKRLFAVGDPIYLERRATALARAAAVPVQALDLAFANWAAGERATLGFAADTSDADVLARARTALGL